MLHLTFTAVFSFVLLEVVHMYVLVAYVVRKDGYFNSWQNVVLGWLVPAVVVLIGVLVDPQDYGGQYQ